MKAFKGIICAVMICSICYWLVAITYRVANHDCGTYALAIEVERLKIEKRVLDRDHEKTRNKVDELVAATNQQGNILRGRDPFINAGTDIEYLDN